MELVGGTDLARTLWDRGNPRACRWMTCCPGFVTLAAALQYLHEQHVVHADVKPRNLVRDGRRVVLVDFGLAGAANLEHAGARGGTPLFMAPEVFAGDTPSARSDVFGIAATAWTLLTGSPPVYGETRTLGRPRRPRVRDRGTAPRRPGVPTRRTGLNPAARFSVRRSVRQSSLGQGDLAGSQ